jgi:FdhD protein
MAVAIQLPGFSAAPIARIEGDARRRSDDVVAVEAPVAFLYNCESHVVMMATPRDLEDFAVGFSIAEGVVEGADEIGPVSVAPRGVGMTLSIEIPEDRARALATRSRNMAGRTGCGLCGIAEIEQALRPLPALPEVPPIQTRAIARALAALPGAQELNQDTGAVHAAAFAGRDGSLLCVREDVGRHNALDKLIGAAAREGLDAASGFIVVTSRCSMEMVQKTATFGCPVLVAVSAPTSLALSLAGECGLTVAAFARGDQFNVYTRADRIA